MAGAGLRPLGFIEPLRYAPESYVTDPETLRQFTRLGRAQGWAAAEALAGNMKVHVLYATRAAADPVAANRPAMVPLLTKHSGAELARAAASLTLRLEVGGLTLQRALPRLAPALLQRIDGRRSTQQIQDELRASNPQLGAEEVSADWDALYAVLNGFNLLLLRRPAPAVSAA